MSHYLDETGLHKGRNMSYQIIDMFGQLCFRYKYNNMFISYDQCSQYEDDEDYEYPVYGNKFKLTVGVNGNSITIADDRIDSALHDLVFDVVYRKDQNNQLFIA